MHPGPSIRDDTMDYSHARHIIETLIEGTDPITREPLPDDSPINQLAVVIALETALFALDKNAVKRSSSKRRRSRHAGPLMRDWSPSEQQKLKELHEHRVPVSGIAKFFQRTVNAVRARLIGLRLLPQSPVASKHIEDRQSLSASEKIERPAIPQWRTERPQAGKPWTAEERLKLKECAARGMSEAEIGRVLGRGEKSVGVQLIRLGIRAK